MAGYFVKGTAGVLSMNELMIHENRDSSPSNKDVVGSLVCARATLQRDLYSFTILDKEEAIAEYEFCKKEFFNQRRIISREKVFSRKKD